MSLFNTKTNYNCGFKNSDMIEYAQILSTKRYDQVTWENGIVFICGQFYNHDLHFCRVNNWCCFYVTQKNGTCYYAMPPLLKDKDIYQFSDLKMLVLELQKYKSLSRDCVYDVLAYNDDIVQQVDNDNELQFHVLKQCDFIFDKQLLLNMSGRRFQNKRAIIHKFKREHPNAIVRVANTNDIDGIFKVRKHWYDFKVFNGIKVHDTKVFSKELEFMLSDFGKQFGTVFVCEENHNILGYVSLCSFCKDTIQTLRRQSIIDDSYKGLMDYMFVESLRVLDKDYLYIDDGNGGAHNNSNYFWKDHYCPIDKIKRGWIGLR